MGVYKRGNTWWIDYYYQGRRVREPVGPSKKQARAAHKARQGEVAQGKFDLSMVSKTPLFREFAEEYLEWKKTKGKSTKRDRISINHFAKFFDDHDVIRLEEITEWHIDKYKVWRKKVVLPKTINNELGSLSHLFTMAVRWKKVESNPMKNIERLKANSKRYRFLSHAEMNTLLECCNHEIKPIVITALNTGMRMGEIRNLQWRDVDFDNAVITLWETKSDKVQHVLINSELRHLLMERKVSDPSEYVFGGEKLLHEKWIRRRFYKALEKVGIEDFWFHDLRHTFASHLVMAGVDLVTVKELMRHSDIKMTMRYAHLTGDHKRAAIEAIYSGHNIVTNQNLPHVSISAVKG